MNQLQSNQRNDACIIGNGKSRLHHDLTAIGRFGVTYGCNAIYRDFIPDNLISLDFGMVDKILDEKLHYQTEFWTQRTSKTEHRVSLGEPINFVPSDPDIGDSGSTATRIALGSGHRRIFIIGFDRVSPGKVLENVYAGTHYYAPIKEDSYGLIVSQWNNRLFRFIKRYPDVEFFRVTDTDNTLVLDEPNYREITHEQFKEIYT